MNYWLFKSEPDVFSFADLKSKRREPWTGVRNYQARNYMRDAMQPGDEALFYHSSCPEPGVAGVMKVVSEPYPDPTQFDPKSEYFDPKATREKPIWQLVDVAWARDFKNFVALPALKADPALQNLLTLRPGNRLSITPVEPADFKRVCKLGGLK
jgi:predicted RNA-binding protein with PUA-like domain